MLTGATHRTQFRTVLKAQQPSDEFAVVSVLSLPGADLAGDRVLPDGLSFGAHAADPWIDLEHGLDPDVGRRPIGWARKSLDRSGAPYSVTKALLDVPGEGRHALPVGTTYFDRDNVLQRQVCHLVKSGALPGVSLEFKPDWTVAKSLGRSPLEARDAYEFRKAEVVRWTHCVEPVCPGALTVLKSLPAELYPLAKVLRDGKVAGEVLHPIIVKSLSRYKPTTVLVRAVETKAMEPNAMDTAQTAYDPDLPEGDGAPALNGVSALYNHAQALLDAADQLAADMESSDAPELRKMGEKLKAKVEAIAEEAKGAADKHDAKLNGGKSETTEPDGDEAADAEPDMDTDDEGTLKAIRQPYKPILKAARAKRYSLAEIRKGIEAAANDPTASAPTEDAATVAARARAERAIRRLERAQKICG